MCDHVRDHMEPATVFQSESQDAHASCVAEALCDV